MCVGGLAQKKRGDFLGGHFFNLGKWRGLIEGFFWGWENSFFCWAMFWGHVFYLEDGWRMNHSKRRVNF